MAPIWSHIAPPQPGGGAGGVGGGGGPPGWAPPPGGGRRDLQQLVPQDRAETDHRPLI